MINQASNIFMILFVLINCDQNLAYSTMFYFIMYLFQAWLKEVGMCHQWFWWKFDSSIFKVGFTLKNYLDNRQIRTTPNVFIFIKFEMLVGMKIYMLSHGLK